MPSVQTDRGLFHGRGCDMSVEEKAVSYHRAGFNCAQSVLCSCGAYTGLDEKTALAVSGGLGGGFRCGEICGALSGAVLAAGLCCPYNDAADRAAKEEIAQLTRRLTELFRERFGEVRCEKLKGDGSRCNEYIAFMAETCENIFQQLQNSNTTGE